MATAVASRFAVLSVDVDDDYSKGKKRPPIQKPLESKPQASKSSKSETNLKKKKKPENVQIQPSKQKKKSNNTSKKKKPSEEQWEEWKQKDSQFVDGNYEEELSQAILLSKIDYEEKKNYYDAMKKANEENKKLNKKNKKTNKAMSLDEFHNSVGSSNSREDSPTVNKKTDKIKEDPEYFDRMKEEIKKEIKKEILKEDLPEKRKIKDSFSQEALTLAQYEDALERRDREIAELKEEMLTLRNDLLNVKTRNKKLCHILANGEMKDKAEVLMEVERLEAVKDELSNEVSRLYAQLEQERSKVRALTGEQKTKDKNKKRTVSSSDTTQ